MISSTLLIKSIHTALSDTPSTVSNANRVLLQNTGAAAEVIIKSDDTYQSGSAAVQGSVLLLQGHELIIKKADYLLLRLAVELLLFLQHLWV